MPDNDAYSQSTTGNMTSGTIETNTAGTAAGSGSHDSTIGNRIATCERLVDEVVDKELAATALADSLKNLGLKAIEAINYLEDFNQRVALRHSKPKQPESPERDSSHESPGP